MRLIRSHSVHSERCEKIPVSWWYEWISRSPARLFPFTCVIARVSLTLRLNLFSHVCLPPSFLIIPSLIKPANSPLILLHYSKVWPTLITSLSPPSSTNYVPFYRGGITHLLSPAFSLMSLFSFFFSDL